MGGGLARAWALVAREVGITDEDAVKLARLAQELLSRHAMSYGEAEALVGDDTILLAHELGLLVPASKGARCLEWDASPLAARSALRLNPAAEAALRAIQAGRSVRDGLTDLFKEFGLGADVAAKLASVALELVGKGFVSGSDVASACRSHGLAGYESQAVALLKASGVMSPLLSSSWPSGDVRYRTCALLATLTRGGL